MKSHLILLIGLVGLACIAKAGEKILPYSAFGPQVAAHDLIGMEWWQWQAVGGDVDRKYPIKVVVYWGQSREVTANRHPVDEDKEQDFRYVEYSKAMKHMEGLIKEFKASNLETSVIEKHLADLKKTYQNEQASSSDGDKPPN